jgi:hypothetical protein
MPANLHLAEVRIYNTITAKHRSILIAVAVEKPACAPTDADVLTALMPSACVAVIVAIEVLAIGGEAAIRSRVAAAWRP